VVVINSLLAFPGILFAIALVTFLGPGLDRLIFALASIGWVFEAARALGARRFPIRGAGADGFIF